MVRDTNADPSNGAYKPYEPTSGKVAMLESSAREFKVKFYRLTSNMVYDPLAETLGCREDFARARDCIIGLEQICEVLEGPYRNYAEDLRIEVKHPKENNSGNKLQAWRDELDDMKKKFEPIQYSENMLRMLFPDRYKPVNNVTSRGSSPPLEKKAI